jgi:O-antigen/teichoic acid export membrane protein
MSHDIKRLGRNFLLSLGGEGLQSGFHFALNLILIRVLSVYDFGLFAIVFVLGGIALSYGNALVSIPATVHMPRLKSPGAVNYQDVVFSSIALVISAGIASIVAAGLWLTVGHAAEALAGGAFIGLWTFRNHVRSVLFARHTVVKATMSDFSYAASGILLVAGLLWIGADFHNVTAVFCVLVIANLAAIVVALRAPGRRPRVSFRRSVWQRYRAIWPDLVWSLIGVTTWNIQGQAMMFLVAAIAGPAAYAPVAAGIVLFSPLRPAISAVVNVFRPDFVSALADGRYRRVTVTLYTVSAIIVLSCLAVGVCIWLGWPLLQAHVFGAKFANASMPLIVTLAGLSALIYKTYYVPLTLVQAAGQFKPVAIATTLGGIVGLGTVSILLATASVAWSLAGVVAGEAACGTYLWVAALRILRLRTSHAPVRRQVPRVPEPIGAVSELPT